MSIRGLFWHRTPCSRSASVPYLATVCSTPWMCDLRVRRLHHVSNPLQQVARSSALLPRYRSASTSVAPRELQEDIDTLRSHSNDYLDGLYLQWKRSPTTVESSWRSYFEEMQAEAGSDTADSIQHVNADSQTRNDSMTSDAADLAKVQLLVRAYQARGHEIADIDPLGIRGLTNASDDKTPQELTLQFYGFSEADLGREFPLGPGLLPRFADQSATMSLRDILTSCQTLYCGSYAVEYLHIADRAKCDWIRDRLEIPAPIRFSKDEKLRILDRLTWSATFEQFMATKHPNRKRYGLEGGESLTPGFKALIDQAAEKHGVEHIVIGMQHRGRMSVMSNVTRKPNEALFYEFSARSRALRDSQLGDVYNHLGWDHERVTPQGKRVHLSILPNPSHLEADDPMATGKVRAVQHFTGDSDKRKTMCLTVHGDAAIAGQGVVYETLGLNNLPAYSVGGTVRIILNNQIGFTTDARNARSTPYCSDIAKAFEAPVFHVNGDDIEAVYYFCQLAADWRATFHTDCVVDIVCYRKFGHNEMDQPMFTQPFMYDRVAQKIPVYEQYVDKLISEGSFTQEEISEVQSKIWAQMEISFEESKTYEPDGTEEIIPLAWKDQKTTLQLLEETLPASPTATTRENIELVRNNYRSIPKDFVPHRNVQKVLDARAKALETGNGVDWATAEALAFGTLCLEGNHVRISGQDVQRGTFSQRHALIHNQRTETDGSQTANSVWSPLDSLSTDQGRFTAANSPLGEYGVLGFEYGYSLASPKALVMWEAQFGDFANNAQVMIDNIIASGETKWLQRSGIVLSLPHGLDNQGPEHSSARIERFLQLCNEDARRWPESIGKIHQACNLQVAYPTTPANLFHVLRRQLHREYRKRGSAPHFTVVYLLTMIALIIFFSKSLLRHPKTKSEIGELVGTSKFQPIVRDSSYASSNIESPDNIKRVILCTGQVYSALEDYRARNNIRDVAITRIEQLHPLPWTEMRDNLDEYSNANEFIWCQEEPMNAGAWLHMQPRINTTLQNTRCHRGKSVEYVGRDPAASTATVYRNAHIEQEERLVKEAFAPLSQ